MFYLKYCLSLTKYKTKFVKCNGSILIKIHKAEPCIWIVSKHDFSVSLQRYSKIIDIISVHIIRLLFDNLIYLNLISKFFISTSFITRTPWWWITNIPTFFSHASTTKNIAPYTRYNLPTGNSAAATIALMNESKNPKTQNSQCYIHVIV